MPGQPRTHRVGAFSKLPLCAVAAAILPALWSPAVGGNDQALRGAAEAARRGQYAVADSSYRSAWQDPRTRMDAAAALRELHSTPSYRLPADEDAIRRTLQQLGPGFFRTETPHFVILSNCSVPWTQSRGGLLERTRHQFFRTADRLALPAVPHEKKLLCVLFADQEDYSRFARVHDGLDAAWVAGYYATGSNRIVFFNDTGSRLLGEALGRLENYEQQVAQKRTEAEEARLQNDADMAERLLASAEDQRSQIEKERHRLREAAAGFSTAKTIHEATHLLAFNTGVQRVDRDYPFWVSEGLATSFETEQPDGAFGPDHPCDHRIGRFERLRRLNRLIPLEQFIVLTDAPSEDAGRADVMYNQAYTLFSHLHRTRRVALGSYIMAFLGEPPGRLTRQRQLELFTMYFGEPQKIERELRASGR